MPRTLPRVLAVHLDVLALVAWVTTTLLAITTRSWFERAAPPHGMEEVPT